MHMFFQLSSVADVQQMRLKLQSAAAEGWALFLVQNNNNDSFYSKVQGLSFCFTQSLKQAMCFFHPDVMFEARPSSRH